eukprot:evm.model.scf_421.4 EVM.evm.TU.scf_421.4   scf_421:26143-32062(-)
MSEWVKKHLTTVRSAVLGEEPPEPTGLQAFWQSLDESTTLSKTQRLYGFSICAGIGLCFTILGFVFWFVPTTFAILYTLGSLLLFGSTFFLMGPWRQLKSIMKSNRILATLAYVGSMILTLYVAFKLEGIAEVIAVIFLLIIQVIALGW